MIPTEQANELIKKLHEEMNAVGKCNTYVITEDVESGNIYMNVCTSDKKVSEEEKRSFSQLFDKIKPYFTERMKDFKEKHKPTEQASAKSLHIDKLIDRLIIININPSSPAGPSPEEIKKVVRDVFENTFPSQE